MPQQPFAPTSNGRRGFAIIASRRAAHRLLCAGIVLACAGPLARPGRAQDTAPPQAAAANAHTGQGDVVGRLRDGIVSYLGIPYAAPPVGALRFRPPAAPASWAVPRDAARYGSACPQLARLGSPSTDEDCLSLNVWTPTVGDGRSAATKSLPVLVFIHGGSFNAGNGGVTRDNPNGPGPDYDGSDLARRGDVVVVTINYRLGLLGFLTSPALDRESAQHVSGNYGLQDQVAALRWVAGNIANFGGDPRRVTVFGESAGGISVLYLLASPSAAGLFARAIVESADDGAAPSLARAQARHAAAVAALGCAQDDAEQTAACLRALPVARILAQGGAAPVIDGITVPEPPLAAFTAGRFNRVPVIDGTNADEGSYFLTVAEKSVARALTPADRTAMQQQALGEAADLADATYPAAAYRSPGAALAAITTDNFFACPSLRVRAALAPFVPVLGYEFHQPEPARNFPLPAGPVTPPDIALGDSHTTELAYVFGHDGSGGKLAEVDQRLGDRVLALWTGKDVAARGFVTFAEPAATADISEADFARSHHCDAWQTTGARALMISVPRP